MAYTLGIDIGIASVGFAAVDHITQKIAICGVHIFEAAENHKDGASLAAPRREKRGLRRVLRRRAVRKNAIRALLADQGVTAHEQIDACGESVWDLRRSALERLLTDGELCCVLFHIAKRRGFQSNRKGALENDTEGKKALSGAKELEERMVRANASTIGAYLSTLEKKRNGDGSYDNFVVRDLLRDEVRKIFEAQRRFGNAKATAALEQAYVGTAFYQRPLRSSEHLIGLCTLEPTEKRAPKFAYTSELFILWSRLHNVKIRARNGGERFLTQDEKQRLADKAHKLKTVSYKQARAELDLGEDDRFNISYLKLKSDDNCWEKIRAATEAKDFLRLPGYRALKDALDTGSATDWQGWISRRRDTLDEIARILSVYEDQKEIERHLATLGLTEEEIRKLSPITSFSKVVDLSLTAMRNILPHMQAGLGYDKACLEAGYHHSQQENKALGFVPVFKDIRNPVVNRALAQARKVINAIIRRLGMPELIIVELAREVGRNFKDRKEVERLQKQNESYREEAKKHIAECLGILPDNVSGEDMIKYRLWKEQQGVCPYSGIYITPDMLRDPVATQVDHIIPYSRSWNDSYMNKVLCLMSENQAKGNETPVEYFRRKGQALDALEVFAARLPRKKAENLLTENFDEEKSHAWKDRALNDTRYMAKLLRNHLQNNLAVPGGVQVRNGLLTSKLRGAWGFPDKDRRNDRHHALDAIVIACSTQSMVQQLANWNKYEARRQHPQARVFPPKPWPTFREDAKAAIDGIFVSRMPVRKVTGAAHQETIRSIRPQQDGTRLIIQRMKLSALKPDTLENLVDKARNIRLYTVLKERLDAHGGKPDKAFAEPVYMPVNDPAKTAPRVKSVNIITNEKSGVPINGGLASNGDMVRVDVFRKDGKYFLVPVYVHNFSQNVLPNRAIMQGKNEANWEVMNDADFLFSLYRNDYVVLKSKKETVEGYYVGTHRGTGCINIRTHDSDSSFGKEGTKEGLGVKTLLAFEKYAVDYFGNKTRVGKETRLGLAHSDDPESGAADSQSGAVAN